ncbi:rCG27842, isoform CRA_c [Rattus norvegicus]|uniref:RCG27842, isoform CRA_c n=1 Tax=Rattus norvegicus TaxID=10116 RepID=A6IEI8_RAT|nr:rCG27842, isoform CRA_c [Rattus norvegicus]EDM15276.1 rCG27842, isoform CRA_c [Rattus norvegicus]
MLALRNNDRTQGCGHFQSDGSVRQCRHTESVPLTDLFLFSNEEKPRIGRPRKVSCVKLVRLSSSSSMAKSWFLVSRR